MIQDTLQPLAAKDILYMPVQARHPSLFLSRASKDRSVFFGADDIL
jgi:hypothetical protein